jgi:hypothetical protein
MIEAWERKNPPVKIKYSINVIPSLGYHLEKEVDPYTKETTSTFKNEDINLLALCADGDEIEMFESEALQDVISFKWDAFGLKFHLLGCVIHVAYMLIVFIYLDMVYIHGQVEEVPLPLGETQIKIKGGKQWLLLAGVIYPAIYEGIQAWNGGITDYLSDTGNYIDLIYIWGSIAMSFVHGSSLGPYAFVSKLMMCIVALLAIRRTFNILRIFSFLSPIVTMLQNVIYELRIFMTFYAILCLLFSLMLGVLGVSNYRLEGKFREEFYVVEVEGGDRELSAESPGFEYHKIGLLLGNIIEIMRISMGDMAVIVSSEFLTTGENYMFWIIWLSCTIIQCIILMNFIVAEAGNTYNNVSEQLSNIIQ